MKEFLKKMLPNFLIELLLGWGICIKMIFAHCRYMVCGKEIIDTKEIPIIINNYNRLSYLLKLIDSLTSRGYHNIYIIDNKSTYPPLLEYYKKTPYTVFQLDKNVGYQALWKTNIFKKFKNSFYVYTDSDLELDTLCPDDFLDYFYYLLKKYPFAQKVGFGIRIDDLPDCYEHKQDVIKWEKKFWALEKEPGVYRAEIDTTFALYRPFCHGIASARKETYRLGFPYVVKHLPWYVDSKNMSDEDKFYVSTIVQSTHWSKQSVG